MIDVMTAFTLVEHAGAATTVPPQGPPGYGRILNPERQPQRTSDGWINVLAYTRQNYEDLFGEAGRADLAGTSGSGRPGPASPTPTPCTGTSPRCWPTAPRPSGSSSAPDPASRPRPCPPWRSWSTPSPRTTTREPGRYKVIPQPVRFPAIPARPCTATPRVSGEHDDEVAAEVAAWPAPAPPARTRRRVRPWRTDDRRSDDRLRSAMSPLASTRTTWPRWSCTGRRPTTSTPGSSAELVDAVAWADAHDGRAVVLCSEGRHFCAGLDFGSTEQARARCPGRPVRDGPPARRRPAAAGGRRAGFGRGRRARPGTGRRLPGGRARQPVLGQLRPARLPPGLRHLADPSRGRRPPACPRAVDHGRRIDGDRGPGHRPVSTGSTTTRGPAPVPWPPRWPVRRPRPCGRSGATLRAELVERFRGQVDHERDRAAAPDGDGRLPRGDRRLAGPPAAPVHRPVAPGPPWGQSADRSRQSSVRVASDSSTPGTSVGVARDGRRPAGTGPAAKAATSPG